MSVCGQCTKAPISWMNVLSVASQIFNSCYTLVTAVLQFSTLTTWSFFSKIITKGTHSSPVGARCRVCFKSSNSHLYSDSGTAARCPISCYIGWLYSSIWLYMEQGQIQDLKLGVVQIVNNCKCEYILNIRFTQYIYISITIYFKYDFYYNTLYLMLLHTILYWTRQIWGIWKLRPAYSPETPNLGQNRWCFVPCNLEI